MMIGFAALLLAGAPAAAKELPKMTDKALYCGEVYQQAARVLGNDGTEASQMLKGYGKNWISISYGFAVGFSRREVNELRPRYVAEARADVAAKRYRYKDCGSYRNPN